MRLMLVVGTVAAGGGAALAHEKRADSGSSALHQQMTASAKNMQQMKMTGDFDHDFVTTMRQHHKDGIDMAKLALKHAKDAKAREFAQNVVDQQTRELKELDAWLGQHAPHGKSDAQ